MILQYLIETLLSDELQNLSFVDRYGGIVKPVEIKQQTTTGTTKSIYPVSTNVNNKDCFNNGFYQHLIPDDSKKSIVYWELLNPMQNVGMTPRVNKFNNIRYRGTARLVVWLNLKELGFEKVEPNDISNGAIFTLPEISNIVSLQGKISGGLFDKDNISIKPSRIITDQKAIFNKYTYSQDYNYYLYPYNFFAIDVLFELDTCLKNSFTFPINNPIECLKPDTAAAPPITDNQALWLKADAGVNGGTVENGDFVYIWEDQSGNTRHFSQLTFNNQPQYRANIAGVKPALFFNFDTLVLQNTQIFTGQDFTVYAVSQQLVQDQQNGAVFALSVTGFSSGSNRFYLRLGKQGSTTPRFSTVGANEISLGDRNSDINIDHAVRTGSSLEGYRNNELKGTISYGNILSDLLHYVGNWNNNRLIGHVFEIIVYDVAHTPAQQEQNYKYLKTKYAL